MLDATLPLPPPSEIKAEDRIRRGKIIVRLFRDKISYQYIFLSWGRSSRRFDDQSLFIAISIEIKVPYVTMNY